MPRVTITVPEKNAQPYRFKLERELVTLGRGSGNDIVMDSESVSVKHAEMKRVKGGYELLDVGSTNGIKVDGERELLVPLKPGMSLKLGEVVFDFALTDEELEILTEETPDEEKPAEGTMEKKLPTPTPEKVTPRATPEPAAIAGAAPNSAFAAFLVVVLFLIFAGVSFFTGAAIRYQKENDESLLKAMVLRGETENGNSDAEEPSAGEASE